MYRLENVSKHFLVDGKDVAAVKNIDLNIRKGSIYGIIGFSGAGKSTLIRCLNLLETPTAGRVIFDGKNLMEASEKELRRYRQRMGMIFQSFNLLAQRKVIDNVCYPLELAGVKKKEAYERAEYLLKLVGIADKAESYPSQLSGGQKQRVAIARALATNPDVLLCDEATSALDPITTTAILELLKTINKEFGVTIVVITHEMKVVEQICDEVSVMSEGRIVEQGSVTEIFVNPKSEITRKLVFNQEDIAKDIDKRYIRLVFEGQSAFEPVISRLTLESNEAINILGADTKNIGGRAFGQMLIEAPKNNASAEKIKKYLKNNKIFYEEGGGEYE